jgi:hypothetical protein
MQSSPYSRQILINLEFLLQIFEKYSNFMKIRLVGAELLLAEGRTDGLTKKHYEANSHSSQFWESST